MDLFDPSNHKIKPYAYTPPPFLEELRHVGVFTDENELDLAKMSGKQSKGDEKVPITSRVSGRLARLVDVIIQKKLIPGILTRGDFARSGMFVLMKMLVGELKDGVLDTSLAQMEAERTIYTLQLESINGKKVGAVARQAAGLALLHEDVYKAKEILRYARGVFESLPLNQAQKLSREMYGLQDGQEMPEPEELGQLGQLWHEVMQEDWTEEERVEVTG